MDTGFGDLFYQANFEFSQQLLMSLFFLFYLQFLQLDRIRKSRRTFFRVKASNFFSLESGN